VRSKKGGVKRKNEEISDLFIALFPLASYFSLFSFFLKSIKTISDKSFVF